MGAICATVKSSYEHLGKPFGVEMLKKHVAISRRRLYNLLRQPLPRRWHSPPKYPRDQISDHRPGLAPGSGPGRSARTGAGLSLVSPATFGQNRNFEAIASSQVMIFPV